MIEPSTPLNEAERQRAVERYNILDSLPERSYNDITALMAHVCNVPISLVGLIDNDRNWLKSHHGIDLSESPRSLSFCGHAIESGDDIFIVKDARTDPRFHDNPLVTEHGAVGYAGVPLIDSEGYALGTLCVFNDEPLSLDESQKSALKNMSRQILYLLERHLREYRLEESRHELQVRNEELKRFAGVLTHDITAPMTNMVALVDVIEEDASDVLSGDMLEYLGYLKSSSVTLRSYVEGMLDHYVSDDLLTENTQTFSVTDLFTDMDQMLSYDEHTTMTMPKSIHQISTNRAALQQVLMNLISNAIKYGVGTHTHVDVIFRKDVNGYFFSVADDGAGIAPDRQKAIFELFETSGNIDRDGSTGTGIGLATVSKLLKSMGSEIHLNSEPGRGSTFSFTLPAGVEEHELPFAA